MEDTKKEKRRIELLPAPAFRSDPDFRRRASFQIVVRRIERPRIETAAHELNWICQSLGFFEPIDKGKTAATVFKEILSSSENGKLLTSTELAERVQMSRGSVINHINNLLRAGLITRHGRYYAPRADTISRTIEEVESDIEHIFTRMKKIAKDLDDESSRI